MCSKIKEMQSAKVKKMSSKYDCKLIMYSNNAFSYSLRIQKLCGTLCSKICLFRVHLMSVQ